MKLSHVESVWVRLPSGQTLTEWRRNVKKKKNKNKYSEEDESDLQLQAVNIVNILNYFPLHTLVSNQHIVLNFSLSFHAKP